MRIFFFLLLLCTGLFIFGCSALKSGVKGNPPMHGFDQAGSDAKAIQLADSVMLAMGGRANWDKTRYLTWNFFGARTLWWDKSTGNVRIESNKDDFKALININAVTGQIMKGGVLLTQQDSIDKYVLKAKNIWINDAYWLVMPFKLKDSGVTLKYIGETFTQDNTPVDVIELTFNNVGVTPQNKYRVYIDKSTKLVVEWSFYPDSSDEQPRFVTPWQNYKPYGKILLSGDRGPNYQLTDIQVFKKLPAKLFSGFEASSIQK